LVFEENNYSQIVQLFSSYGVTNRFIFIYTDYTSQYIVLYIIQKYAEPSAGVQRLMIFKQFDIFCIGTDYIHRARVRAYHTVHVTTRYNMLFHVYSEPIRIFYLYTYRTI